MKKITCSGVLCSTLPSMMWWSTQFSGDKLEQKGFCHMTVGKTAQEHNTVKCTYVLILLDTVKRASYPPLLVSEKRVKTFIHSEGLHAVFGSSCSIQATRPLPFLYLWFNCSGLPTEVPCIKRSMHEHFPLPNRVCLWVEQGRWDCSLSLMCYLGRWGSGLPKCFIMKRFGKWPKWLHAHRITSWAADSCCRQELVAASHDSSKLSHPYE